MTNQHPITPPPELVQEWIHEPQYMTEDQLGKRMNLISMNEVRFREIIDKISQYSADQELEACCEWVATRSDSLQVADIPPRRPPPQAAELEGEDCRSNY
jgi:hypothetical protein